MPRSTAPILTGLLGQIAQRKERNLYTATSNRLVTVFPGSGLYARQEKRRKGEPPPGDARHRS